MLDTSLYKEDYVCVFNISGSITEDERYASSRTYGNNFFVPSRIIGSAVVGTPIYSRIGIVDVTVREMMELYTITENVVTIGCIGINSGIEYKATDSFEIVVTAEGSGSDIVTDRIEIRTGVDNETLVLTEQPALDAGYNIFKIRVGDITKLVTLNIS